ncbi:MAG: hypothetical protein AB1609_23305 [Bacillota bacterium]
MKPYLPRLVLGVGVLCLLMSAGLYPLMGAQSYLGEPTCQRVLSFLADHGYFDPARHQTSFYRSPISGDATLRVSEAGPPGRRVCAVLIPADPTQPVTAAPEYQQLKEVWASFDRQEYPINPRVVRDILLADWSHRLRSEQAYFAHHGAVGLLGLILWGLGWVGLRASLPLLGPQLVLSLCRLGFPFWFWLSVGMIAGGIVWLRRLRHRG